MTEQRVTAQWSLVVSDPDFCNRHGFWLRITLIYCVTAQWSLVVSDPDFCNRHGFWLRITLIY